MYQALGAAKVTYLCCEPRDFVLGEIQMAGRVLRHEEETSKRLSFEPVEKNNQESVQDRPEKEITILVLCTYIIKDNKRIA